MITASECMWTSQGLHICADGCSLAVSQGVEDKDERDAAQKQQATAAPASDNSTRHAVEHVTAYPSRLIYYLNKDSESAHHDLDTRAKNQAKEGQVRHHLGRERWKILIPGCSEQINSKSIGRLNRMPCGLWLWSLKCILDRAKWRHLFKCNFASQCQGVQTWPLQ